MQLQGSVNAASQQAQATQHIHNVAGKRMASKTEQQNGSPPQAALLDAPSWD